VQRGVQFERFEGRRVTIGASWKNLVPPKLRRLRSEVLHAWKGDDAHIDRIGARDFLRHAFRALAFNGIEGNYAEFGCCGGQTFGMAYQAGRHTGFKGEMWAFDSFQGLPPAAGHNDEHPMWIEGDMSISLDEFRKVVKTYGVREGGYRTVEGFYNKSLADVDPARSDRPRKIALAYVDCDLYSSTMDVLRFLHPRLRHGMILAFDDYFCWSETAVSGERAACSEVFGADHKFRLLPYLPIGWAGMSFVVEDRALLTNGGVAASF
jgi:O-methyltransferase